MDGQQQHQWQRSTFVLRLPNDEAAVVAEGLLVQHDPRYVVTYRCIVSIVACSLSLLRPFCHPCSRHFTILLPPHINTRNRTLTYCSLPATLFARITWYWHGVIVWTDYFLDHYEDDSDSSSEDSFYDEESSDEDYEDYYEVPGYDDDRDFEDYQYADGV